jgi:ribosomal protein L11
MRKSIILLLTIFPLFSNAQSKWGKEVWEAYMNSCVETAKSGMSEDMAKSYCACTGRKLEGRYPDATKLGNIQSDEITELATICLEEINGTKNNKANNTGKSNNSGPKPPTPPGKTSTAKNELIGPTNWSQAGYDAFMGTCVDSAKDALGGEAAARKYCDCSASKLQVIYPDETKVGNVTEAEINKIAEECLGN